MFDSILVGNGADQAAQQYSDIISVVPESLIARKLCGWMIMLVFNSSKSWILLSSECIENTSEVQESTEPR